MDSFRPRIDSPDITLDVVFSRFKGFLFKITVTKEFRAGNIDSQDRERACK